MSKQQTALVNAFQTLEGKYIFLNLFYLYEKYHRSLVSFFYIMEYF